MNTVKIDVVVPTWADWIAQDDDGEWRAHEQKPFLSEKYWMSHGSIEVIATGVQPENWEDELYSWNY